MRRRRAFVHFLTLPVVFGLPRDEPVGGQRRGEVPCGLFGRQGVNPAFPVGHALEQRPSAALKGSWGRPMHARRVADPVFASGSGMFRSDCWYLDPAGPHRPVQEVVKPGAATRTPITPSPRGAMHDVRALNELVAKESAFVDD